MRRIRRLALVTARLALGGLALANAACATADGHLTPSRTNTTLMAGWDHWFQLDSTVEPHMDGTRRIRGYISSRHGQHAEPVRVLGQALDPSGAVVGQRIAWVPGGVPGLGRSYFEIAPLPTADHYTVTVWAYTIFESDTIRR